MKKTLLQFLFSMLTLSAFAQDYAGALNANISKHAVSIVSDFGTGFHTIFYTESSLEYTRFTYDFTIETQGSIDLKLGYKHKILEINASRKNINVFYHRLDSAGLWLLKINTVSGKSKKHLVADFWTAQDALLSNFSIGDSAHFILDTKAKGTVYLGLKEENIIINKPIKIDSEIKLDWAAAIKEYPQFSKILVHESQLSFYNKLQTGLIKAYSNQNYTSFTIDNGFKTHLVRISKKQNSTLQKTYNLELNLASGLSGAIMGSLLRGKYLFQSALLTNGCIMQKYDLQFEKMLYNQFIKYSFSKHSGSPVYFLNRRDKGNFENDNEKGFELHDKRLEKFVGINITKKGPFDHFMVSEIEPISIHENWLKMESNISPKVARRKKQAIITLFGVKGQSPLHFAMLSHFQCMSTTFCFSLSKQGEKSPFLGEEGFPFAKMVEIYSESIGTGAPPFQPTLANINNKPYYCFYKRTKKQFYFIPL